MGISNLYQQVYVHSLQQRKQESVSQLERNEEFTHTQEESHRVIEGEKKFCVLIAIASAMASGQVAKPQTTTVNHNGVGKIFVKDDEIPRDQKRDLFDMF